MVNTGMRPKEFLTLKWKDISSHKTADPKLKKKIAVISIRAENSKKLGEQEILYPPVRRRLEVIKQAYKDLGFDPQPNDFVLFNVEQDDRRAYTRQTFFFPFEGITKTIWVTSRT